MKIVYWISTGLFCAMMVMGAFNFIVNTEMVTNEIFLPIGAPAWLVLPLGVAKLAGAIAVLIIKSKLIKQLAYVGFGFDFVAAIVLHLMAGDGNWYQAGMAMVLMLTSYYSWKKTS